MIPRRKLVINKNKLLLNYIKKIFPMEMEYRFMKIKTFDSSKDL